MGSDRKRGSDARTGTTTIVENTVDIDEVDAAEVARLAVLRDCDVLDTAPEAVFDDLTRMAAQVCGTPMAVTALIDVNRQWFKSRVGFNLSSTRRDVSFGVHAFGTTEVMVVPNARVDARFYDNPLVTGDPWICFYAAMPLTTEEGHTLGALSVCDTVPRVLGDVQLDQLATLGRLVLRQLLHRRQAAELMAETVARRRSETALREAVERHRQLFDQAPVGLAELRSDGSVLQANQAMADLLEVSPGQLTSTYIDSYYHPDERSASERSGAEGTRGRTGEGPDRHLVTARGNHRWVTRRASRSDSGNGRSIGTLSYMIDSTDEHTSRQLLADSTARFAALVEHNTDAIAVVETEAWTVLYASPAFLGVTGIEPDVAVASSVRALLHPADVAKLDATSADLATEFGRVSRFDCRIRHVDARWRHVEVTATNRTGDPAVGGIVVNLRDVTEQTEAALRMAHQSMHDTLTDLPNRALLLDRLDQALDRAVRSGRACGLFFIDLDRFTQINDTLGHAVGDELLKAVATRLLRVVRPGDSVARLGGDEFVVLAENVDDAATASNLAERIRASVAEPIELAARAVVIGCSVGISLSTRPAPDALLQEADMALFRAKESGRNRWELYDQAMRVQAHRRLEIEDLVRSALRGGLLAAAFQPIVDLTTGVANCSEALARIVLADGTVVVPDDFIPVAEDSGLIVPLGAAMLQLACTQQARWHAAAAPETHVAVNVSARQLSSDNFVGDVSDALRVHGLPAGALCIEITESALIEVGSSMQARLHELKALGVTLAIDDFGTGWSSLGYLRRFPIDVVKIDRSFVAGLGADTEDSVLVRAVIDLGRALGIQVVAEGVETGEQDRLLRELGCTHAQGFLYGHPRILS